MRYRVEFAPSAARAFRTLERVVQTRLAASIDGLARSPRPRGAEKLQGREDRDRLRVGDYRIVYDVQDEVLLVLVLVLRVAHRRGVYRRS